jgi:hypothetical protein
MILLMHLGYRRTFLDIRQFIAYTRDKDSFEEIYNYKKILTIYASSREILTVHKDIILNHIQPFGKHLLSYSGELKVLHKHF